MATTPMKPGLAKPVAKRKPTPTAMPMPTPETGAKSPSPPRIDRTPVKQFRFGYLVHDVSRTRRTLMDHYMRPLGITRSQWSMLSTLSRGGNDGMMQVDIARLLDVGKVSIGGLIDRLEATGHVERRPDATDRRAKRVFITDQGYRMLSQMVVVATELNALILDQVTREDLQVVEKVLKQVKANIRHLINERQPTDLHTIATILDHGDED